MAKKIKKQLKNIYSFEKIVCFSYCHDKILVIYVFVRNLNISNIIQLKIEN